MKMTFKKYGCKRNTIVISFEDNQIIKLYNVNGETMKPFYNRET